MFKGVIVVRLWAILPDETVTDDRAYLIGHLKCVFDEVETTFVPRTASGLADPKLRPDLILNLAGGRSQLLLAAIDTKAARFGVPVSPPSVGALRTEDKRTYVADFPDVSPPTRIARSLADVRSALDDFSEIVVKDPFGIRGQGVERIACEADLGIAAHLLANTTNAVQELVVQPFLSGFMKGDKRVIVQRSPDNTFEIIGQIFRKPAPGEWKSNIRNGGKVLRTRLTDAESELALKIAPRTGIDNVTLDIGEHDGRLFYIEHNQGYGGIIDFDLDHDTACVRRCAEFLVHVARYGRPGRPAIPQGEEALPRMVRSRA